MKILLTGATGFLGSALATAWAQAGHQVVALTRSNPRGSRIDGLLDRIETAQVEGMEGLAPVLERVQPEVIVHTACAYGRQGETLLALFDANLRLGIELLAASAKLEAPVTFINTGTVLDESVSPYALSKRQFSAWGRQVSTQRGGDLRFANVLLQHMYGAGDSATKFTTHVIRSCVRGVPELDLTAGEQQRDFIYIDDVVSAYTTLLDHRAGFAPYEDFEVGSGDAPSVRSFVETVHRLTASTTRLRFGAVPYRSNEAMYCKADLKRMNSLGWRPRLSLAQGLGLTIALETELK